MLENRPQIIAFYLPQFYPIPENDQWWGRGFTEWRNVGKAKALYRGHYQPRIPGDLGYYDLRNPETRQEQADMARTYGLDGFCYWHYWFGNGMRLLERPFNEVLASGKPDFPFMLSWANESWKGFSHGLKGRETLIEQKYPSERDCENHFYSLLPAFKDSRYICINKAPVFMIYHPEDLPEYYIEKWRHLAEINGLCGINFMAHGVSIFHNPSRKIQAYWESGYDSICHNTCFDYFERHYDFIRIFRKINPVIGRPKYVIPYRWISKEIIREEHKMEYVYPTIIPNWDHTPRSGRDGKIFHNSTPELFQKQCIDCRNAIKDKKLANFVFVKSWNEWAEGNHLEPDLMWDKRYLEVIRKVFRMDIGR